MFKFACVLQVNKGRYIYLQYASIIYNSIVMKEIIQRSDCPISFSLDYLGDKWTLLILRDLIFTEKSTYGEFLTSQEKIATNILADRLRMLEANGFITSSVSAAKKNKFNYSLTEKGIDLVPVIVELMIWGSKYDSYDAKDMIKKLGQDKEGTIKEIRKKLSSRINDNDSMQA
jgi:DNA-binding HxlR family transcriptional regulator